MSEKVTLVLTLFELLGPKVPSETKIYTDTVLDLVGHVKSVSIILAPPFTGLFEMSLEPPFYLAAQNCHWEDSGAFTGEISASMLKGIEVNTVIIGHSERRSIFNETDEILKEKVKSALSADMEVIFCFGEELKERKNNDYFK